MTSLPPYKARKSDPVSVPLNEPIEFSAIDWYECDLTVDTPIEKKDSYLNQDHNKTYTIFIFGCNSKGQSICLRVRNYLPYFYVQIPDDFNEKQIQDFVDNFSSSKCEDYDEDELAEYEEAQEFKNYKFTEEFKRGSRYYKDSIVEAVAERGQGSDNSMLYRIGIEDKKVLKTQLVEKKIFWSFMNEQKFTFLKLAHKSKMGHRFMERSFKNPMKLKIKDKVSKEIKYNLFESDLEPILRFLHDTKIKPSSWIRIEAGKFKVESRQSKTQINISCDWADIHHLDKTEIPPILIASFDIEADSSHGDFPIPKKDCKKLSSQLVVAWIRDMRNVEKKGYEKVPGFVVGKSGLPIELHYSDKKNEDYDSEMMAKCKSALEGASVTSQKEITYLREVIKYIKSKQNLSKKKDFFVNRIKQALGAEQFAGLDDDIDLIYLKKPIKAKVFTNSSDFAVFIDKIYNICNRPIRKVKANNEMKKAVKEVTAIESAKTKTNPRFTIDDLVKIINEVAKKNKIPEKDLQDKIITKETMVRFINILLNRSFGHAEGDKVIQIGTVFWRYGEPEICHNNIITLKGCSAFKVGDKNCEVISKTMERDVLLEWSKLIELHDPDIIIGYNTFGFDESFMYDRIADLCIDVERATLTKEDIKTLEQNTQYNKFINMGRLVDNIIKKVPDAKGAMINKKLSSSALGDNFLYYFNMPGRVQIDLLKVCQASLTKLPSYKLDSVAEFYISGKIKEIGYVGEKLVSSSGSEEVGEMSGMGGLGGAGGPEASCYLKVDNIVELEVGNYIVISMSATTAKLFDGEKLKILEIDRDAKKIKVDRAVPKSCLGSGPVWGMGKDDITPQDIFRMQKGTDMERAEVAKYCIQDCVLLIRLLRKLEVVPNNFGMSNVCLVPFAYIFLRGQGIKAFSLVTNECAKEDFLLPVLEKIEPEEEVVDDGVRRVHTVLAGASGGDVEDIEAGELGLEEGDLDLGAGDLELEADGSDGSDGEEGGEGCEEGKSKVKFSLKSNFNQIIMNEESYEGAIVLNPKTDIYIEDPITVLDFSSLYPSEMITSDLSHDRICEDPYWLGESGAKHLADLGLSYLDRTYDNFEWINSKIKSQGKRKCGTTTVRFVQYPDGRKGLIPRVLQGLLKSRKDTKKKMEAETDPFKKSLYDGLQLAYKVTANSIYGQIGAKTSKVYKPQIASCTCLGGRLRLMHARDFVQKHYKCEVVAGDTDSLMIKFDISGGKKETLTDREKIIRAIAIGQEVEKKIKGELPGCHVWAYEKVLFPAIFIAKKRYLALKYEDSPDSFKFLSMGVSLKRTDSCAALKHILIGVIDCIIKEKNIEKAIKFVQDEIKKMIDGEGVYDMGMFVISKKLAAYYKDEESIAHKVLANRVKDRDPGNAPVSNERVPYLFIKIKEEKNVDYLQGDRIETPSFIRQNNLQIDYEKYILNQIMKPVSQIFELVVEKLSMFPHGSGYYQEMYNIWYNKYGCDIEKTEKKIRQLKALMVQKLIFQPLIDYANSKVNKVATIDNWFKAEEVIETEVKEKIKVEKPKHEIKVKKTKQLSLDSFF